MYTKTNWTEATPITAANLNHIESGIAGIESDIKAAKVELQNNINKLDTKGTINNPFGDLRTQTLFSKGDISTYGNVWMNNSLLYNPRKIIQQNAPIDIETKGGVGIKGGPLYLNGNSIIYTYSLAPYTLAKIDVDFNSILDNLDVVETQDGLGLVSKTKLLKSEEQAGIDLVSIISALVAKVRELDNE